MVRVGKQYKDQLWNQLRGQLDDQLLNQLKEELHD